MYHAMIVRVNNLQYFRRMKKFDKKEHIIKEDISIIIVRAYCHF